MENLFKDLAWKCYQYELRFEYVPASEGITVFTKKYELVTAGWLDGIVKKELEHMHKEVDMHISSLENHETEYAQADLTKFRRKTENERLMEESGHTIKDFM